MAACSDSRKRTLEALERRFAVAKAELLHKEKKTKTTINEDGKPSIPAASASNDGKPRPSSDTPKKGISTSNFVFFFCDLFSSSNFS